MHIPTARRRLLSRKGLAAIATSVALGAGLLVVTAVPEASAATVKCRATAGDEIDDPNLPSAERPDLGDRKYLKRYCDVVDSRGAGKVSISTGDPMASTKTLIGSITDGETWVACQVKGFSGEPMLLTEAKVDIFKKEADPVHNWGWLQGRHVKQLDRVSKTVLGVPTCDANQKALLEVAPSEPVGGAGAAPVEPAVAPPANVPAVAAAPPADVAAEVGATAVAASYPNQVVCEKEGRKQDPNSNIWFKHAYVCETKTDVQVWTPPTNTRHEAIGLLNKGENFFVCYSNTLKHNTIDKPGQPSYWMLTDADSALEGKADVFATGWGWVSSAEAVGDPVAAGIEECGTARDYTKALVAGDVDLEDAPQFVAGAKTVKEQLAKHARQVKRAQAQLRADIKNGCPDAEPVLAAAKCKTQSEARIAALREDLKARSAI